MPSKKTTTLAADYENKSTVTSKTLNSYIPIIKMKKPRHNKKTEKLAAGCAGMHLSNEHAYFQAPDRIAKPQAR